MYQVTPQDDTKKLTSRQRDILGVLMKDNALTRNELAQRIGVSSITIQRELDILKSLGVIMREGGKTHGHWVVAEKE